MTNEEKQELYKRWKLKSNTDGLPLTYQQDKNVFDFFLPLIESDRKEIEELKESVNLAKEIIVAADRTIEYAPSDTYTESAITKYERFIKQYGELVDKFKSTNP